ncbi:MAG: NAD-dependent epimerase/dehydratase family protein [Bacteroidota bacterium]
MTVAILGAGWLGEALGWALGVRGDTVHAATTTPAKMARLRAGGMEPFHLKVTPERIEGDGSDQFFDVEALVVTLPPGRRDPNVLLRYGAQIDHVIKAAARINHVIFTSSTSVYPDLAGAPRFRELDAATMPDQISASGNACLAAEQALTMALDRVAVLRLGGLYGPGRTPARYLAGRANLGGGDRPVNLVHRSDVIAAIQRVLDTEAVGTYNLAADEHPTRREFYPAAARALGLEPPTFAPGDGPVVGKWVSNAHAKDVLGIAFRPLDPARHAEDTASET